MKKKKLYLFDFGKKEGAFHTEIRRKRALWSSQRWGVTGSSGDGGGATVTFSVVGKNFLSSLGCHRLTISSVIS